MSTQTQCRLEYCDRRASFKKQQLCTAHEQQWRKGNPFRPLKTRPRPNEGKLCTLEYCDRPVRYSGLCSAHNGQRQRGEDLRPLRERAPNGSWTDNGKGYLVRVVGGKTIYQHRTVMEEYLNRPLLKKENVHHKNGNRSDNRIENLELWVKFQPSGQRAKDLLEWAELIIARYGPEREKLT